MTPSLGRNDEEIDAHYGELYRKAYGDRGDAGVEALLREETIADMFADYSLNGRRFATEFGRQGRTIDDGADHERRAARAQDRRVREGEWRRCREMAGRPNCI